MFIGFNSIKKVESVTQIKPMCVIHSLLVKKKSVHMHSDLCLFFFEWWRGTNCVGNQETCFLLGLFWLFSSVAQSCPTLCNPMNRSTPGLPVHHQLPESTQTYVHRVGDAIQPSHPLSSPSPPALNLSQHQGLKPELINFISQIHFSLSKR